MKAKKMRMKFDEARVTEWRDLKEKIGQSETEMIQELMARHGIRPGMFVQMVSGQKLTYRFEKICLSTLAGVPVPILYCYRHYKSIGREAATPTFLWPSDVTWIED